MPEIQDAECSENKSIRYDLSTQSISLAEGSGGKGGGKILTPQKCGEESDKWNRIEILKA